MKLSLMNWRMKLKNINRQRAMNTQIPNIMNFIKTYLKKAKIISSIWKNNSEH